jgi:hypothetical protein
MTSQQPSACCSRHLRLTGSFQQAANSFCSHCLQACSHSRHSRCRDARWPRQRRQGSRRMQRKHCRRNQAQHQQDLEQQPLPTQHQLQH